MSLLGVVNVCVMYPNVIMVDFMPVLGDLVQICYAYGYTDEGYNFGCNIIQVEHLFRSCKINEGAVISSKFQDGE